MNLGLVSNDSSSHYSARLLITWKSSGLTAQILAGRPTLYMSYFYNVQKSIAKYVTVVDIPHKRVCGITAAIYRLSIMMQSVIFKVHCIHVFGMLLFCVVVISTIVLAR